MSIGILGSKKFALLREKGGEDMNACVCDVSFFPWAYLKQPWSTITHNTCRQCRTFRGGYSL